MKKFIALALLSALLAPTSFAAKSELQQKREQELTIFFLAQANLAGSKINQALQELNTPPSVVEFPLTANSITIVQTSERTCEDPAFSEESRGFTVFVHYLDHAERNLDKNDDYLSNVAVYETKLFRCGMTAESYGSSDFYYACEAK